jgi:hypothetical protein
MKEKKEKKDKTKQPEKTLKEIEFEKLSLFFDKYISNGKLITKYASLFGLQRITYIKGKDLKQFFTDNFSEIKNEMLKITNTDIGKEPNQNSLQNFYELNQKRSIFHYLQRIPGDKAKYPKKLLPLKKGDDINLEFNFTDSGFYSLNIKVEKTNRPIIYLILLVILILLIVMFPIWPLNVKIGVLYFLMSLIIFLIAFLVFNIVLCIGGILAGYDIVIMPNIDDTKLSWKDRLFSPFILIEGREDPCCFKVIRIFIIISFIIMGAIAYCYPEIPKESFNMIKRGITTLYGYAKVKIEDIHYQRNSVKVKENKYLDDLNNL